MLLAALALQAAAGPTVADERGCRAETAGEVVVCGRREASPYRLKPLGEPPAIGTARDPLGLAVPGGGQAKVHAIRTGGPNGQSGQGAAVTMKWALGKRGRK